MSTPRVLAFLPGSELSFRIRARSPLGLAHALRDFLWDELEFDVPLWACVSMANKLCRRDVVSALDFGVLFVPLNSHVWVVPGEVRGVSRYLDRAIGEPLPSRGSA